MIAESYKRKVSWRQVGDEPPQKLRFVCSFSQKYSAAGSLDKPREETHHIRSVSNHTVTSRKRKIPYEYFKTSPEEDSDIRHFDTATEFSETAPHKKLRHCVEQQSPYPRLTGLASSHTSEKKRFQGTMTLTPGMRTEDEDPMFNNFNFWKPVLPDIKLDFGNIEDMDITETQPNVQHEDPAFNSFNFWKPVLPDIDFELSLEYLE